MVLNEMEKRTTDTIIASLKNLVETKTPVSPGVWVEAASDLNILLGDEHDILFDLQQKVAQLRLKYLNQEDHINVSEAKIRVEATDEYRQYCAQRAKIGRIEEQIRIAKVQSRLKDTEFKGY